MNHIFYFEMKSIVFEDSGSGIAAGMAAGVAAVVGIQ